MEGKNCWKSQIPDYSVHKQCPPNNKLCCMFIWNKAIFLPLLRWTENLLKMCLFLFSLIFMGHSRKLVFPYPVFIWLLVVLLCLHCLNKKAQCLKVQDCFYCSFGKAWLKFQRFGFQQRNYTVLAWGKLFLLNTLQLVICELSLITDRISSRERESIKKLIKAA